MCNLFSKTQIISLLEDLSKVVAISINVSSLSNKELAKCQLSRHFIDHRDNEDILIKGHISVTG